ncbi:4-azaleucine resistance transporter AzlC [Kribbella voronezhensis]|uniref:4-azaleucine resistance transporter AzlC n=1 Tax=Kribbella voronezhensis TaxID=2512212 RepID=A0A4R7TAU3_9ACTN|nr:AzlC family ABC transporter permease [Kribbella voronezhensis]TDU89152.1 4-azaleucine resistance transporter AzlC [Kribbella voronezhensis]
MSLRTEKKSAFLDGMRLGIGPATAGFVLALSFGAEARARGWGFGLPILFSMFAFSGSAQFTLLTTLAGGSAVAAVTAAVLINARYLVMSLALNDSLQGGRLSRALQAQTLVDASFVVAHRNNGEYDVGRLIGASATQWLTWVSGTAIGVLLSPTPDLMHRLGLDVAFPAFFVILALDELRRSSRALVAAVLGAAIAAGLLFVTAPGYALLGATAAALLGVLPEKGGEQE